MVLNKMRSAHHANITVLNATDCPLACVSIVYKSYRQGNLAKAWSHVYPQCYSDHYWKLDCEKSSKDMTSCKWKISWFSSDFSKLFISHGNRSSTPPVLARVINEQELRSTETNLKTVLYSGTTSNEEENLLKTFALNATLSVSESEENSFFFSFGLTKPDGENHDELISFIIEKSNTLLVSGRICSFRVPVVEYELG